MTYHTKCPILYRGKSRRERKKQKSLKRHKKPKNFGIKSKNIILCFNIILHSQKPSQVNTFVDFMVLMPSAKVLFMNYFMHAWPSP